MKHCGHIIGMSSGDLLPGDSIHVKNKDLIFNFCPICGCRLFQKPYTVRADLIFGKANVAIEGSVVCLETVEYAHAHSIVIAEVEPPAKWSLRSEHGRLLYIHRVSMGNAS